MNPRTACLVAAAALVACPLSAHAGIVEAEYFVGPDPGAGQGIALTVASSTNAVATDVESASIALAGLAPGTHDLAVRAKDSAGRWSTPLIRRITVHPSSFSVPDPEPVASYSGNGIVAAEYFVGPDPGAGSGTTVEVSAEGASAAVDAARPLANTTSPGVHDIGLRVKDGAGRWSSSFIRRTRVLSGDLVLATLSNLPPENSVPPQPPLQQTFLVGAPDPVVPAEAVHIGAGGATVELAVGPSESADEFMARLAEAINSNEILAQIITASTNEAGLLVTTAQPGLHPVSWLETSTNLATVIEQEGTIGSEGRRIVAAEYFVGEEPEPGTGTPFEFVGTNSSAGAWEVLAAPTAGIASGTSKVGIRFKNAAGQWGNALLRGVTMYPSNFTVAPPTTTNASGNQLLAAEFFVGTDPGQGRATSIALTTEGLAAAAENTNPFAAAAQPGTYTLGLRFQDSAGRWGNALVRRTTIQPQEAVTTTVDNLPSGNSIPPQPASQESYLLRLAGEFHCDGVFSVSIGENSIEVPARPFETAAAFLERLALAINSDPFLSPLATAVAAGSSSLTLTAKQPGLQPAGWVQTSTNLTTSITRQGTLGDEGRKIVAAEYFVGLTPSPGNGVPISISGTDSNAAFFAEEAFTRDDLRDGPHPVGVRFKNAAGKWGQPIIRGLTSYALFETPDRTAPSILLSGSADLELAYGTPFTEPGYTATDDVDGDVTSRVVVRGQVDTGIPGTYTLQYWVDDTAGNRSSVTRDVVVTDTEQPAFIGGSDIVHTSPPATIDLFAGLRAVDPQFGDLSYSIKLTAENVDWFAPGTYTAHFEVVDPAGNKSTLSRNITLNENAVFYPAFATWIGGRSASAGASANDMLPQSDPDGDGQSNEQEWQADTDPFSKWSVLSMQYLPSANTERMRWAAMRRISYIMEASPNLIDWQDYGELVNPVDDCVLDYEFVRDSSKPRLFYRLRATPRQPLLELP